MWLALSWAVIEDGMGMETTQDVQAHPGYDHAMVADR